MKWSGAPEGSKFRGLLDRLVPFKVTSWGTGSQAPVLGLDREVGSLEDASVISSLHRELPETPMLDFFDNKHVFKEGQRRHTIVLDVDHPMFVVESTNSGVHGGGHLYVDIPGGVPEDLYFDFLELAAKIGLIEQGYAEVSIKRGHTDVRLPWVSKHDANQGARPTLRCVRCELPGQDISEYRDAVLSERTDETMDEPITDAEVLEFIWENEGTLNHATGLFACTQCYIAMGMPTAPAGSTWTP